MSRFKEGDNVRLIRDHAYTNPHTLGLSECGIYTVKSVTHVAIKIDAIDHEDWWFDSRQFELIPAKHTFKVGDRVKVIDNKWMSHIEIGSIHTVTGLSEWDCLTLEGSTGPYHVSRFELVKSKTERIAELEAEVAQLRKQQEIVKAYAALVADLTATEAVR